MNTSDVVPPHYQQTETGVKLAKSTYLPFLAGTLPAAEFPMTAVVAYHLFARHAGTPLRHLGTRKD